VISPRGNKMLEPEIIVYGTRWCGDCLRTRRYLEKYAVPFQFIDIDKDKVAEGFVLTTNHGIRSVPTIVFGDGSILVEPNNLQLKEKLHLAV
ncbi:MAG TPA: glutaredoxin domain-containing protein, partial [Anaerolineales bacterium]|nr:glutaredoxin domain-containing protein [Anaerolineales bacterium]